MIEFKTIVRCALKSRDLVGGEILQVLVFAGQRVHENRTCVRIRGGGVRFVPGSTYDQCVIMQDNKRAEQRVIIGRTRLVIASSVLIQRGVGPNLPAGCPIARHAEGEDVNRTRGVVSVVF